MKSLMNKFGRSLAALLAFAMVVTGVPNVGPFKAVEAKAAGSLNYVTTTSDALPEGYTDITPNGGTATLTGDYSVTNDDIVLTTTLNGGGSGADSKKYTKWETILENEATTKVVATAAITIKALKNVDFQVNIIPNTSTSKKAKYVLAELGSDDSLTTLFTTDEIASAKTLAKTTFSLEAGKTYQYYAYSSTNSVEMRTQAIGYKVKSSGSSTPAEKYTVSFNSLGGSEVASITDVEKDAKITAPTAPTKDGYDFAGWCKEEACTNAWNFATDKVTGNTTLFAKWTAKVDPSVKYTVTFDSKDGSAVASATVSANSVVPKPADPTKEGFDFAGWYKEEAYTNAWNFATDIVTGDTTLFAKWTEVKAVVSKKYVIDTAGTVANAIPEEAKDIVKFVMSNDSELSGPTLTCKAKIDDTEYTEGFNLDGRIFGDPVGISTSAGKVLAAEFDRPGTVSLKIWAVYSKGDSTGALSRNVPVAVAKKTSAGSYSILGTSENLQNAYAETVVLSSATPTLSVGVPVGVPVVAGDTLMIGRGSSATNADVLRVELDFDAEPVDEYTVSFNMLGHGEAAAPASKTVVSGSKIKEPTPAPKVEGWLFKGWFKEEACTNAWDFENDTITANTVIYAKWEQESADAKYTVTFDANGHGTAPAAKADVPTGTTIEAPTAPTAEGFEFLGWYKEAACTNAWNFEEDKVTEDITLFAKWEKDFTGFIVAPVFGLESGMVANTVYGTDVTFMAPAGFSNKTDTSTGEVTTIKDTNKGGLLVTANKAAKLFARVKSSNTKHLWVIKFAKEENEIPSNAKKFTDIDTTTYKLLIENKQFPDSGLIDVEIDMEAGYSYFISLATESDQEIPVGKLMYKLSGAPTTTYDVTVNTATNGTVSVDKTKAAAGEVVTVTTTPAAGYVLDTLTVMNGTSPVTVAADKTFTMPAGNVTVTATFKAQGATEYTVTVAPTTNGTVTANKSKAVAGDIVTLTVAPAAGYVLDKLTVMNGTSPVTVTKNQFTMPAGNVTVTATFKAQGAPTPAPIPEGIDTEEENSEDGDYVFTYESEKDFTGAAIKPFVAVEYNGVTLVPGVDYSVAYKNNKNVYTAKQDDKDFDAKKAPQITITGKGNYVGKDAVLYFTINEVKVEKEGDIVAKPFIAYNSKDASGDEVDPVATKKGIAFTGDAIDPIEAGLISLKTKAKVANVATELSLEPGVDYVYSIANNINVGTANIYVKCMGKYKGEAKLTFKIAKADLSQLVDAENRVIGKFTFKAKGNKPVVEIGDLLVGSDYKLAYKNNVKVNTPVKDINEVIKKYLAGDKDAKKALSTMPTVTATGTGNYTGKLEFFFDIDKADINSDLDVYMTAVKSGAAISSAVPSVFDADGNILKAKTDFVVDYYVSVDGGEAQLIGAQGVNTGIKDAKGKDIVVKVGTKLNTLDPEVFTITAVVKANTPKTGNATVDGEYSSIELVNATEKATLKSALTDKKFAAIYTGEAIELEAKDLTTTITVGRDKPVTLTLGTDYEVVYSNNVNKGTATAYIIPSTDGVTSGEKTIIASGVVKVTFKINPNTIAKPEYK